MSDMLEPCWSYWIMVFGRRRGMRHMFHLLSKSCTYDRSYPIFTICAAYHSWAADRGAQLARIECSEALVWLVLICSMFVECGWIECGYEFWRVCVRLRLKRDHTWHSGSLAGVDTCKSRAEFTQDTQDLRIWGMSRINKQDGEGS